jgi:hypothetical protein
MDDVGGTLEEASWQVIDSRSPALDQPRFGRRSAI